eukprot:7378436-Pyramimonas_sp.AAC.1
MGRDCQGPRMETIATSDLWVVRLHPGRVWGPVSSCRCLHRPRSDVQGSRGWGPERRGPDDSSR